MRIWKYPFLIEDQFSLEMPDDAKVIDAFMQGDMPCLWAIVDEDAPKTTRQFRLVGTGHSFSEDGLKHLATFPMAGGELIWHLFERTSDDQEN
jgi:hypothetical protein